MRNVIFSRLPTRQCVLEVIPVIDYGIYQERIATTVYESHRANAALLIRREQQPASSYVIIRKGNTLHYAKIDPQKKLTSIVKFAKKRRSLVLVRRLNASVWEQVLSINTSNSIGPR